MIDTIGSISYNRTYGPEEKKRMGANFYWRDADEVGIPPHVPTPEHIGRLAGAGLYCWDCNIFLREGGIRNVHSDTGQRFDACPVCGKRKSRVALKENVTPGSLGFFTPETNRPTGVRYCSSFSWGQEPDMVEDLCRRYRNEYVIKDEYEQKLTGQEFIHLINRSCPIWLTHSVGVDFR